MPFEYVSVEEAIAREGLRMVVVGGTPSPWGESAKGVFHVKSIPWVATRLVYDQPALQDWAGELTGPVAVFEKERPRSGWAEIVLLAERIAPTPSVLPGDPTDRALVMGLCHELLGEQGLAYSRRLQAVHAGLQGNGGFTPKVAGYLAKKYGYTPEAGAAAGERVASLLRMFAKRVAAGSGYLVGDALTAADIQLACCVGMFNPLPPQQCAMRDSTRATFGWLDATTAEALDPALVAFRDRLYAEHLELPLSL